MAVTIPVSDDRLTLRIVEVGARFSLSWARRRPRGPIHGVDEEALAARTARG
jgi:hypothetical protein